MLRLSQLTTIICLYFFLFACGNKEVTTEKTTTKPTEATPERTKTADFNASKNAYFGDLHIHTSWSFDAFIYNTRTTPDDAYLYGKGEAINHSAGLQIKLGRPLDFMAVTDHAEYMGMMKRMIDPKDPFFNLDVAKDIRSEDAATSMAAFSKIGTSIARNAPFEELIQEDAQKTTWEKMVSIADKHYMPGKFTTFPAYEWTSTPNDSVYINGKLNTFARNMHRNIIFKSSKVPDQPYTAFNSTNPEDLWNWLDAQRSKGVEGIAIPHNGNMSDGMMYATTKFNGSPMTLEYIQQRMRNEPINEVIQIKGQSMTHPILAPNDEFADFELFAYTFSVTIPPPSKPQNSYVAEAYQNGLGIQQKLGGNPFKFGLIGSSDGHNSAGATEENNYFGKFGVRDGTPKKRLEPESGQFLSARYMSAAGLAGVWAEENTREAIFAALERKETFATSGTRMKMRFFAGYDIKPNALDGDNWVADIYANCTPMGGDLKPATTGAIPSFLIWAVKDAEGANLDRVQVIKAWVDATGETHEKIFDAVWSGDRKIGKDGKLPPVGSSVNVKEASYDNSIGAVSLKTVWQDPEFDANQSAMYYLRVLEIPTPRWSTYDAKALGITIPDELEATIQERAWSSPIWYK